MKLLLAILIIISFTGCEDDKQQPIPNVPECYEKFLGNYRVYNTDSNNYYNMSITYEKDTSANGNLYNALVYHNFANKFVFKYDFYCIVDSTGDNNYLDFGRHDTAYDANSKRWFLFPYFQDSLNNKTSWFHNDTINLYFDMCNIAYYIYDLQPYYCKQVMHIAVKQH